MVPTRHYPHAPITEAIIDLRVEPAAHITVAELAKVHEGLETAYPTKKSLSEAVIQGQVSDQGAAAATTSKQTGHLFVSGDGKYVFQARLNGYTMSRLAPYESWEPFRNEARRLWNVYRSIAIPVKVVRVAVRTINRLDLPLPVGDLKEYLRTVPEVSSDLPQQLAGYFMQLQIPQADIDSLLLINQAIIEPFRPGVASVVLDIDVFKTTDLLKEEDDIWAFFETLHERRNSVFEACITDKARGLFQQC